MHVVCPLEVCFDKAHHPVGKQVVDIAVAFKRPIHDTSNTSGKIGSVCASITARAVASRQHITNDHRCDKTNVSSCISRWRDRHSVQQQRGQTKQLPPHTYSTCWSHTHRTVPQPELPFCKEGASPSHRSTTGTFFETQRSAHRQSNFCARVKQFHEHVPTQPPNQLTISTSCCCCVGSVSALGTGQPIDGVSVQ